MYIAEDGKSQIPHKYHDLLNEASELPSIPPLELDDDEPIENNNW